MRNFTSGIGQKEKVLYLLFSTALFLYIALRAVFSGILHDEAFSFLRFIHTNSFLPFAPKTPVSANNHYLNSLLTWLSFKTFGVAEWIVRLPNVLAFAMYLRFIYLIGTFLKPCYLRWLFWVMVTGAHYYLEFFGYSRGYGLSLGLLAGSIYYLIIAEFETKLTIKYLCYGLLFIFLASFANLNLMVSYAIWLLLAFKSIWTNRSSIAKKGLLGFSFLAILLFSFQTILAFRLLKHEVAPIGEDSLIGFFNSLLSLYVASNANEIIVSLVLVAVIIAGGVLLIISGKGENAVLLIFYSFFILNMLGSIFLNLFLKVNYPIGRTGFQWYFFIAASIPFIINRFNYRVKAITSGVTFLLFAPVFLFSLSSISLYSSVDKQWSRQQISDELLFKIDSLNGWHSFPLSTYGSEDFYTTTLSFKMLKNDISTNVCNVFPNNTPPKYADLLIVDTSAYNTPYHSQVYFDAHSGMSIMQRSSFPKKVFLNDSGIVNYNAGGEFVLLGDFTLADNWKNKPIRLNARLNLTSKNKVLLSFINVEIIDSIGKMIFYEQMSIDYMTNDFRKGACPKVSVILDSLPQQAHSIRCVLWNYYDKTFTLNSSRVELYQLVEK